MGIPTRYAVGYSVDEYSALEGQYIVRSRHAHSWTLVYVDEQWVVMDTTPSIWAPYEQENASAIEPLMDLWSWITYTWSRWQSDDATEEEENTFMILWLLFPLIGILAWRIYFRERIQKRGKQILELQQLNCPGKDSRFYELVNILEKSCRPRQAGETLPLWIERIENRVQGDHLQPALDMHYQYRFDPAGISSSKQKEFHELVEKLLASKEEWLAAVD